MNEYRTLDIWQEAIELGVVIHRLTHTFPEGNNSILRDDLMRSAARVATKLAEGYVEGSEMDLAPYIQYSMRSCAVLDCLLTLSYKADYITQEELEIVRSKISALMKNMEGRQVIPWSQFEDGWHYEPEEESESSDDENL